MTGQAEHDRIELAPQDTRQGLTGADILGVLAISTFLAAIGLITFFVTTAHG